MTYTLLDSKYLSDIDGQGNIYCHNKSKATIVTLACDDPNKTLSIGFRTPVNNNSGIPHILEHSVLEGSKKYPLKDPFVQLMKGSLNTFLNAMTYDQFTIYPVASCNITDFKTLTDVYLDAVYHPLVINKKEIFAQEGWHYEYDGEKLFYNGVVFNEMKGAMTSYDFALSNAIAKALYPSSDRRFVAGGLPHEIVELTYEQLIDYYNKHYHPSNSIIVLYGDMNMDDFLTYLDSDYLSHFNSAEVVKYQSEIDFKNKNKYQDYYPVQTEEELEKGFIYAYSWRLNGHNLKEIFALNLIDYVLVEASGGLLREELNKEGIGDELSSWLDLSSKDPSYTIYIRKARKDEEKTFYSILENILKKALEGLDLELSESFMHLNDYALREDDYGRTPKGLVCTLKLFEKMIYNEDDPLSELDLRKLFQEFREDVKNGYTQEILKKLISNNNSAQITLVPSLVYVTEYEDLLAKKEKNAINTMDAEKKLQVIAEAEHLNVYRQEKDSTEALNCIPVLERNALKDYENPFKNRFKEFENVKLTFHDLNTNGINYLGLYFDISSFECKDYPLIAILCKLIGDLDTINYDYAKLDKTIGTKTGGISTSIAIRTNSFTDKTKIYLDCAGRFLNNESKDAFNLIKEILFNTLYTDDKRIKKLLYETKATLEQGLVNNAQIVGVQLAGMSFESSAIIKDYFSGRYYYKYLNNLLNDFDAQKDELIDKLINLSKQIFIKERLSIFVTAEKDMSLEKDLENFILDLPHGQIKKDYEIALRSRENIGLRIKSQVNYCTAAGKINNLCIEDSGHLLVLAHILNTDYFWQKIRVEGGAYGASANFNLSGLACFGSYRDPECERTYDIFKSVPQFVSEFNCSEREMRQYVIGTMNIFDTPLSASKQGHLYTTYLLTGLDESVFNRLRHAVINCSVKDINNLSAKLTELFNNINYVTVASDAELSKLKWLDRSEDLL